MHDIDGVSGNASFLENSRPADQCHAGSGAQEGPRETTKQPVITEGQLVNEVRGIYARLVMLEKKCIEIGGQQWHSKTELSQAQWQSLVSLHRTLLYEYHDFLLASQHPSASPILKALPDKHAVPARMWRYGMLSFLSLLLQKLPGSMEYMLNFIYFSYSMITVLLERVSDFNETWMEFLGDLARFRMVIKSDKKDHKRWAEISRYWYNQAADRRPEDGRIQHHLAVLARPDVLRQFFHYTKALTSVHAFSDALDGMTKLVSPLMSVPPDESLITSFVTTHGTLFMQAPVEEFVYRANVFLATLSNEISKVGRQGVQLMSCNISAIFQYGSKYGVIDLSSQLALQASSLAFHTLIVMLGEIGDPNMCPSVHISMAFVWCLTHNPAAIQQLGPLVPWPRLATYLNSLFQPDTIISKVEDEAFPLHESSIQQLPEDFLIRGQTWTRLYYPERFFEGASGEDNRLYIEEHSTTRAHRCLWLGVRIATRTGWLTYNKTRHFTPS
ncbi:DNA/RNA-binding domain E.t1.c1-type [Penicillium verrucosum]|uniref:DNA/RNA-binding domain E.t1.c1-type n=1 Tax=Penicillium verrucosum TaxID=60171 RepID=UPI0025456855|nr:DNA/RNA-binding domain E.t1.c1-type [Penicillium verrucosum]KAJ5932804.1 DNA/RNA-binding domain E.t1.c1-type [Penicillium verrucosum]